MSSLAKLADGIQKSETTIVSISMNEATLERLDVAVDMIKKEQPKAKGINRSSLIASIIEPALADLFEI